MDEDPADRRRAAALAGHTGDVTAARAARQDADASVRAAGLGALDRLGALTPDDLVDAAGDAHATVRRRCAELIGRRGPRPTPGGDDDAAAGEALLDGAIVDLLGDRGAAVAEAAAWAAGERWGLDDEGRPTGAPAAVMDRVRALAVDSDDALARESAVAALGAMGDPAGEAAVVAAMDGPAVLRRRAVLALAAFDGPDAAAALRAALGDRDWQVRQAAEDLLDARPTPDVDG